MRQLRTLVVVHASLVPPESLEGHGEKEIEEWRTEYDVTSNLRTLGHEVRCIGVLDSLTELRSTIADWEPDVVFNLLEEFDGIVTYDQHVVAFLELMRQPYTGCNPRGLLLSRDKTLCKQLLSFHRIATPQFAVFRRGARFHVPRKLRFPLFVKSTVEDASLGIAQASVVEDAARLKERIAFVHEQVKSDALVEEYIEGRELYVGVMGNERLTRLPVWEMVFGSMPDSLAAIALRSSVRLSSTPSTRTSWPRLRRLLVTSYSVRHSSISLSLRPSRLSGGTRLACTTTSVRSRFIRACGGSRPGSTPL